MAIDFVTTYIHLIDMKEPFGVCQRCELFIGTPCFIETAG